MGMRRVFNHSEGCLPAVGAASLFIGAASNFLPYPLTPSRAELWSVEATEQLPIYARTVGADWQDAVPKDSTL